jgi:hypothetical protein
LERDANESVYRRKLWGTDIYTDDSDVVAALYHCGHVNEAKAAENKGDCVATLLILPALTKYLGSYRNGFRSRSWLVRHDGVSFMIHDVKFVQPGKAETLPPLKKQRLLDWGIMRDVCERENPRVKLDSALVDKIIEKAKEDKESKAKNKYRASEGAVDKSTSKDDGPLERAHGVPGDVDRNAESTKTDVTKEIDGKQEVQPIAEHEDTKDEQMASLGQVVNKDSTTNDSQAEVKVKDDKEHGPAVGE